ncbi:hypothetical protein K3N28_19235 [Glycomyces sp. TRM65418]|uniref:hypothetical protein n=1 Tax=Glycomyces sp. TRM65418 TaxID=2867006 RepID=UPI001CE5A3B1|nr:hypothetical protein [Glycomyces sp. TRM65418]MCC3765195.1 hypothetical protein [Glycomyces sp. TRM65418]QZD54820.1 hypothetical protein K3N28_19140 [Glycomyces sp. TRM65418]
MLIGVITGCNYFSFLSHVENTTADRIDWNTFVGNVDDPYPPDVWIEGNNGRDAMRVNYKGKRTEFAYTDYTNDNNEIDTMALAVDVVAHLERSIAADPNPASEAKTPDERREER